MKILAVDPGEKRIGIAVSDPTGTIANPLTIIEHISRPIDAAQIVQIAEEHDSGLIVIGQALDEDGKTSLQGRHAARLSAAIQTQSSIPVILWDESNSTQIAHSARLALGARRKKRREHVDDLAATVILQTFLDSDQAKYYQQV
jgi:putative Holliday junction resolvase